MKLNRTALFSFALLIPALVSAQTNTLPSSGNVGIGTTTPGWPLVVLSGSPVAGIMRTNVGAQNSGIVLGTGASTVDYEMYVPANSSDLRFFSSADRVTFTSSGNVGIGTNTPGAELHLAQFTANMAETLRLDNTANVGDNGNKITWRNAGQTVDAAYVGGVRVGATVSYALTFATSPNWVSGGTSAVERMRIDGSGNVGIGTTAPVASLNVQKNGAVATDYSLAQLMIGGGTAGEKRLALGYDTTSDLGLIQAYVYGGTVKNLILQSAGGNVGIGTINPTQKLSVNGTVRAKEVIVDTGWSDYVFDESYRLAPLAEVEQHIKTQKHLPGIPSAAEVAEHGISVGEMQSKLLAKIEEITLRQIAQEKEIAALKSENAALRTENSAVQSQLTQLGRR